jgi:DNA invertase Pin-like site-specific DNA recombinase
VGRAFKALKAGEFSTLLLLSLDRLSRRGVGEIGPVL